MGRTKPVAKRRRIEDEDALKRAIETLQSIPQEQVEAAAAIATRESCEYWPKVENDKELLPDWLTGLGVSATVPPPHCQALKSLHEKIKQEASVWTSWSGSPEDPRKRAFGFLPGTLGYDSKIRESLDISTPWSKDDTSSVERKRNHRAMVVLDDDDSFPAGAQEAIEFLCESFSKNIPESSPLRKYLQYSNLIAAQPNLHCGRELLPTHFDHPKKDGFGVIIVTISIVGSGIILLDDSLGKLKRTMQVSEGQAYMLSDKARDACAHGVLAASGHRESLNLRFGQHDLELGPDHPMALSSDVLQHWEASTTHAT
jgi:hypothetical protein